jgi:hypothetical protein
MFGDDAVQFLFDLRNFNLHFSVPLLAPQSRMSWSADDPVVHTNSVLLKRVELVKYRKWSSGSKRFMLNTNGDIDFVPIIERYVILARLFFGWFWRQVMAEVASEVDEYVRKSNEYGLWLAELNVEPEWEEGSNDGPPMPVPGSMFVNRCRATRARADFGTDGWRTIAVDGAAIADLTPTDWEPLPKFRR